MSYNNLFEIELKAEIYGKKYNLKQNSISPGWNDEVDAFRHAFMQALYSINRDEKIAKFIADSYENIVGFIQRQKDDEKNMDLWNNRIGREIGKEILKELDGKKLPQQELEDLIAEKVIQRLRNGDMITHPSDKRKYAEFITSTSEKSECSGSYPVSGYVRSDGTKVSGYVRNCYKHSNGKTPPKTLHNLPKEEMEKWIRELI